MRAIGMVLLALLWAAGLARAQTVECGRARLAVSEESRGIAALLDTETGRDFAAGAQVAPLYEITFRDPDLTVSPRDAGRFEATVRDGLLHVTADEHRGTPVRVECSFRPDEQSQLIIGRIRIACDQPRTLVSVRFPTLTVRLPIGDTGADDAVLMPHCDGCIIRDPLANNPWRDLPYPGSASMQMLAAYDPACGVYLAALDGTGHRKVFTVRRPESTLQLGVEHLTEAVPREEWELPYGVAITTFGGAFGPDSTTWESAADIYRRWAVRRPWCRQKLFERVAAGDVPAWLAEPSLFYAYTLRGGRDREKNRLDQVVPQAEAWQQVLDAPVTFMLMSWEKKGPWVTPDYFPPFGGEEAFRAATRGLHANGHRTLVFLSGLNWTLEKTVSGPPIDQTDAFEARGRAHAIADATGEPVIRGEPDEGVGRHARICAATPLAREILLGSSIECQRLGIDCVQVDQIVGGGQALCYSPDHGHPPGGGNWCARRMLELLAEVRLQGKARDADFAFSIEEPGEFFIPVLDTYHARDYMQARWPRYGPGAYGVPLFTHVYHDYVHGYGGDSCPVSSNDSPTAVYAQGMNLVCGKAPGVAVWTRDFDPLKTHETQKRLLRAHCDLWRSPARDFLAYGQRLAEPPLDVPVQTLTFRDWSRPGGPRTELEAPTVLRGSWRHPQGLIGRVYVNIADRPITFSAPGGEIRLEPGEAVFRQD